MFIFSAILSYKYFFDQIDQNNIFKASKNDFIIRENKITKSNKIDSKLNLTGYNEIIALVFYGRLEYIKILSKYLITNMKKMEVF